MERCERVSIELDADRTASVELARTVARLRIALDEHDRWEQLLLEPILRARGLIADAVERMTSDHAAEHRFAWARLNEFGTATLRAAIARLREHLDLEERYLIAYERQ